MTLVQGRNPFPPSPRPYLPAPPRGIHFHPINYTDTDKHPNGVVLADLLSHAHGSPYWRTRFPWWDDISVLEPFQRRGVKTARLELTWPGQDGTQFAKFRIEGLTPGGLAVVVADAYARIFQEVQHHRSAGSQNARNMSVVNLPRLFNLNTVYLASVSHVAPDIFTAHVVMKD